MTNAMEATADSRLFDVSELTHTLTLAERFTVPPFSVLNTRDGWWQTRKGQWLEATGMASGEGRGRETGAYFVDNDKYVAQEIHAMGEQSIFDPVLCELAYRWYCPPGGSVVDPFAGGSVRGLVASWLGLEYTGIDLSGDQVQANYLQVGGARQPEPLWLEGDSLEELVPELGPTDLIFSCPPYYDLEHYTEHPSDLSNMAWEPFLEAYREIIRRAVALLRSDRFACWVIGEVRDKRGAYRNLVGHTIEAFEAAGARYYNDAVIVNAVGTARLRAANYFPATRKLCRVHQQMLTFVKGDPKRATQTIEPRPPKAVAE